MPVDYRFEILKTLHESANGKVNFRPIFMPLILSGQLTRLDLRDILLQLKESGFILVGDLMSLYMQQYNTYDDEAPINVKLEHKGIDEYFRLKKQYDPMPARNVIQILGNFTGNLSQDNQGPVRQSTNNYLGNEKYFLFSIVNNEINEFKGRVPEVFHDFHHYEDKSYGVEEIYYKTENQKLTSIICEAFNEESAQKAVMEFLSTMF